MSKETTKSLVPKLRFPEFRDMGEWNEKTLGEIATRISQKNIKGEINRVLTNSAVDGILDQRDYFDKDIANKNNLEGYFIVKEGDYVYNPRASNIAPVGPISKNKTGDGVMSPLYTIFRFNNNANDFYEQYFKTTCWYKYLQMISNSGARHDRLSISTSDFMDMPIPEPKPAEQQKIADCLSSIDELIAAQNQKLETLKAHKKGLMQQLFPAEGETMPKLRFAEFRDAGEWEEIRFMDVTDKKTRWNFIGGPFGSNLKASDYVVDGIRIIQLQNIGDAEFIDKYKNFTSEEKADELLSCNIYPGDIIVSKMGDPVGRACLIPNLHSRYIMCSDGIRVVVDEHRFNKYFIYTLINSIQFRSLVERNATGSTRKRIGLDTLKALPMIVSNSIKEQQKIADCLLSIDEFIAALSQKIETLKTHKKGLMQQLFPNASEADKQ